MGHEDALQVAQTPASQVLSQAPQVEPPLPQCALVVEWSGTQVPASASQQPSQVDGLHVVRVIAVSGIVRSTSMCSTTITEPSPEETAAPPLKPSTFTVVSVPARLSGKSRRTVCGLDRGAPASAGSMGMIIFAIGTEICTWSIAGMSNVTVR